MDELKPCVKCGGKGVERIGYTEDGLTKVDVNFDGDKLIYE